MFVATFVWRFLTFTGFSNDHYAHLALAQQMLLGERPIRDFSDPGWPLTYVDLGGRLASGRKHDGSRVVHRDGRVCAGRGVYGNCGAPALGVAAHRIRCCGSRALDISEDLFVAQDAGVRRGRPRHARARRQAVQRPGDRSWPPLSPSHSCCATTTAPTSEWRRSCALDWQAAATGGSRSAGRRLFAGTTAVFVAPWALYVALNGGLVNYFDRALEYARIEANATTLKTSPRFTLVPGQPLFGLARPNRPLAQVSWKAGTTDTQRQSLEQRYGLEYVT